MGSAHGILRCSVCASRFHWLSPASKVREVGIWFRYSARGGPRGYLSTLVPRPVYPITKLMFSFSPFAAVFVFSAISKLSPPKGNGILEPSRSLLAIILVVAAAFGSFEEYRLALGLIVATRDCSATQFHTYLPLI